MQPIDRKGKPNDRSLNDVLIFNASKFNEWNGKGYTTRHTTILCPYWWWWWRQTAIRKLFIKYFEMSAKNACNSIKLGSSLSFNVWFWIFVANNKMYSKSLFTSIKLNMMLCSFYRFWSKPILNSILKTADVCCIYYYYYRCAFCYRARLVSALKYQQISKNSQIIAWIDDCTPIH